MPLKPCRECGQEFSNKAKTCPNCGTEIKKGSKMMFDDGFDEYIKQDKIKNSSSFWDKDKDTYYDLKSESDEYFRLDSEIKNSKTKEDKIKLIDQILSIDHIEICNYDIKKYSNIRFYFN